MVSFKALAVAVCTALVATVGASPAAAAEPRAMQVLPSDATRTGLSPDASAASCYEIKQLHPDSDDGAYWLLTPALTAPQEFWCDMTTDGGGWVRIGSGREQWNTAYDGKGLPSELATKAPPLTRAVQLPSTTVDALLDGGRVDDLGDGVRLRRALNGAGSEFQEVRFDYTNRGRWVWTFGAEHRVATYDIGGTTGSGGQTNNFGSGSSTNRVDASIQSAQGYRWGFAYGSSVEGSDSADTYLWSRSNGQGSALPYTEVYLRPELMSTDLNFQRVPDSGAEAVELVDAAENAARVNPWGVTGTAGSTSTEGNVEVQALEQIGNVMFVGGNFKYVQRDSAGTDRVQQSFLAAFDSSSGQYLPGFAPVLNEQVRSLKALPNGSLAVGGDFTQVNGQPVQGLVTLNAASGGTATGWGIRIENGLSPGVVRIESLDLQGERLYLGGSFTHLSKADGSGRVYARNAGRVSVGNGTPDLWNPEFNGTVLDLSTSEDGARTYYSGFFGTAGQSQAFRAAAVMNATARVDATPWNPTWSSSNKNYQRTIDQVGSNVWVGGSEHSLFNFSTSTYEKLGGSITKRGGDFQAMDGEGGLLYAGCHCNNWIYQDAYTWSNVGTGWNEADAIGWFGAWDATTGDYVPQFTPQFGLRLGSGIWAIEIADDGTVWAGGDITSGLTTSGGRWLGGFARWAPRDTTAPGAPSGLRAPSQTSSTVSLAWDVGGGGAVGYQVLRDDRVIATTSGGRSITVPKGGENRFFVRAIDGAGNVSATTSVLETGDGNPPVAQFSVEASELAVSVDASASSDADGQIDSYEWEFGDGESATGSTAEHTYAAAGTYSVTLTVTDNDGAQGSVSQDVTVSDAGEAVSTTVIERDTTWSWYYESAAPQSDWKDVGADVSSWQTGAAPLGFGFSGVATDIDINGPTSDRPRTAYFVREFVVDDADRVVSLSLDTVANDGVVVYVNGAEVGRHNMREGVVTHTTFAPTARNVTTANNDPVLIDVPVSLLVDGTNVVTAETHVNYRGTRDVSFELDAELTSVPTGA